MKPSYLIPKIQRSSIPKSKSGKRAYLIRYGAYGDHISMSNVIKALDIDGWYISYEYNWKGSQIHTYNPRIDEHVRYDPHMADQKGEFDPYKEYKRHNAIQKEVDLFVNFGGSLERALIAPEDSYEYFLFLKQRRAKNTHICYYDQSMIWAGLTDKKYMGWTGEVFFKKEEHQIALNWARKYEDKFILIWCLRGSMWQKAIYPIAKDICDEWLNRHPNSVIVLTGDDSCKEHEWEHPKVLCKSGRIPFRQALCMTRYADLVVTPETGLGIGAGAFGRPKIMLLTAASVKNIAGNDENDFSLQSPAWCSPCTRAIYNTINCPVNSETQHPICVEFPKDMVLEQMEKAYAQQIPRNWTVSDEAVYM